MQVRCLQVTLYDVHCLTDIIASRTEYPTVVTLWIGYPALSGESSYGQWWPPAVYGEAEADCLVWSQCDFKGIWF